MLKRLLIGTAVLGVFLTSAGAQTKTCVPLSGEQLVIYRAGSLTRAFVPLEEMFRCQSGIQVKDVAMGSVDAGKYADLVLLDADPVQSAASLHRISGVIRDGHYYTRADLDAIKQNIATRRSVR